MRPPKGKPLLEERPDGTISLGKGKYERKTLREVAAVDPKYIEYLLKDVVTKLDDDSPKERGIFYKVAEVAKEFGITLDKKKPKPPSSVRPGK